MLGPAFVAAVAYVDPGNFATNIGGGSKFGYLLLWVIVGGEPAGHADPEPLGEDGHRDRAQPARAVSQPLPASGTWGLWVQAELVAMATDLAEFVGAAIALNLLFGVPLFEAGLMTAVVAFAVLGLQRAATAASSSSIVGMLGVILLGFLYDTLRIGFDAGEAAKGLRPGLRGTDTVLLATGILGATVMPHVIYLHSALTQRRIEPANDSREARAAALQARRRHDRDGARGARRTCRCSSSPRRCSTATAHRGRHDRGGAHGLRGRSSAPARRSPSRSRCSRPGFASSSVGTYAGQVVMQGFIARTIPLVAAARW